MLGICDKFKLPRNTLFSACKCLVSAEIPFVFESGWSLFPRSGSGRASGVGRTQTTHSGKKWRALYYARPGAHQRHVRHGRLVLGVGQLAWLEMLCAAGERIRCSGPCGGDLVVVCLSPTLL